MKEYLPLLCIKKLFDYSDNQCKSNLNNNSKQKTTLKYNTI